MAVKVLVVDDDPKQLEKVAETVAKIGAGKTGAYAVVRAGSGATALSILATDRGVGIVLADVRMDDMNGVQLVRHIRQREGNGDMKGRDAYCILMTAGSPEQLTRDEDLQAGIFAGADDFLPKSLVEERHLKTRLYVAEAIRGRLIGQGQLGDDDIKARLSLRAVATRSPAMMKALERALKAAPWPATVLLQGATGTGKEVVARMIHHLSGRPGGFHAVNCGGLSDTLASSDLFGHVKGAYTGAENDRKGAFKTAERGTLFLDEIGELSLPLQANLLRTLQERTVQPVGEDTVTNVDIRLVAATNRNLKLMVREQKFRADLFWRLNVVRVTLPRLAHRPEDVEFLAVSTLKDLRLHGGYKQAQTCRITPQAMGLLRRASWPGNVRDLRNRIEEALVLAEGADQLDVEHFPDLAAATPGDPAAGNGQSLTDRLRRARRRIAREVLERHNGNLKAAATELKITIQGLRKMLGRVGLRTSREPPRTGDD